MCVCVCVCVCVCARFADCCVLLFQHDAMKRNLAQTQTAYGSFQEAVKRLDALVESHRQRVR